MSTWTCPKCGCDRNGNYCHECGTARPEAAAEMTEDERMADELRRAHYGGNPDLGRFTPFNECPDDFRELWLSTLAKARELLAKPLPSVEELAAPLEALLRTGELALSESFPDHLYLAWAKRIAARVLSILAAPPAQPEPTERVSAPEIDGDEESGQCDEDCELCAVEGAMAHADEVLGKVCDVAWPEPAQPEAKVEPPATVPSVNGRAHVLKCWPGYFQLIAEGRKPFEIRRNDRRFLTGDRITVREWNPSAASMGENDGYSGREISGVVTCVVGAESIMSLRVDGPPILDHDYVVLGMHWELKADANLNEPQKATEPAAPAASAEMETIALDAWLDSRDVMQSTRSEVRHCYRADLARATKALRDRAELAERKVEALDRELVQPLRERAEKAERERDEAKAELGDIRSIVDPDLVRKDVTVAWLVGQAFKMDHVQAAEIARLKADLAALRASQPAGLPGDESVLTRDGVEIGCIPTGEKEKG